MALKALESKPFPKALAFRKLIGPSFIILGVGLGSGELILWPYLASNFGLGLIWAAILGITFQFFINMEIERYALARGESVFVGFTRRFGRFAPFWFIATTLTPWLWPGIIASAAKLLSAAFDIPYLGFSGIVLLVILGALFSLGSVIYKTQEKVQKVIILLGVPFIFLITLYFAKGSDWANLIQGMVGNGEGFKFIPNNLPFASFLAALAYAGAGGNLNLAQSFYIKEKGYGMGAYSGRITNILKNVKEDVRLEGFSFENTLENRTNFNLWWRRINLEHGIVFWATGAFTMLLLSLLAYTTVFGNTNVTTSINFVIEEGLVIGQKTFPLMGKFFLLMASLMLFGTQFSVYGSNSRIASENLVLVNTERFRVTNLSKYFYIFLWGQILAGISIFALGFTEPLSLVIIGAVLNAISMFIYSGMLLFMNHTLLDKPQRPSFFRTIMLLLAFSFYGGFSAFTIYQNLIK